MRADDLWDIEIKMQLMRYSISQVVRREYSVCICLQLKRLSISQVVRREHSVSICQVFVETDKVYVNSLRPSHTFMCE